MVARLFIAVFAVVTGFVTPVFANPPAAASVEQVVVVAEKIAAGRLTQAQAAQLLGSNEAAASLFGAVKGLEKAKGAQLSTADMSAIRAAIKAQDVKDASAVVTMFVNASKSDQLAKGATLATVFGQTKATANATYAVADTNSGIAALSNHTFKDAKGAEAVKAIVGDFTRAGRQRLARLAAMYLVAANVTPGTCSAGANSWCRENAPEVPALAASLGIDNVAKGEEFVTAGLKGFPEEKDNYVGQNERVVRNMIDALKMGENMPSQLKSCFYTGTPSAN